MSQTFVSDTLWADVEVLPQREQMDYRCFADVCFAFETLDGSGIADSLTGFRHA